MSDSFTSPTRAAGDSTNANATTAFVATSTAAIFTTSHTWTAAQTFSAAIIITSAGISDTTAVVANPAKFWYPTYYTNPGTAVIHRLNRALVGEASLDTGGVGVGATPLSWSETYFPIQTVSQLAVGCTIGTSAVGAWSRTSDYRTWSGSYSLGSQALTGFALNDDTGAGTPTAAAVVGLAIRKASVTGLTVGAQFDCGNEGSVVNSDPFYEMTQAGTTVANLLTSGTATGSVNNVSMGLLIGPSGTGAKFEKGIVVGATALNPAYGPGGGLGVGLELANLMSIGWVDAAHNYVAQLYAGGGLLVSTAPFYSTNSLSTAGSVTAGTNLLSGGYASAQGRIGFRGLSARQRASIGDAQIMETVFSDSLATVAATRITVNGAAADGTNSLTLVDNSAITGNFRVLVRDRTTGDVATGTLSNVVLKRGAGVATTTVVSAGSWTLNTGTGTLAGMVSPTVAADTTYGSLSLSITLPTANACSVVASWVQGLEVQ